MRGSRRIFYRSCRRRRWWFCGRRWRLRSRRRVAVDRLADLKGIYPLAAVLKLTAGFTRLELSQFGQGAVVVESLVGKASLQKA